MCEKHRLFPFFATKTSPIVKGVIKMILFTILAIAAVVLAIIAIVIALIAGASTVVVFGDAIVCVILIWVIVRGIKRIRRGSR